MQAASFAGGLVASRRHRRAGRREPRCVAGNSHDDARVGQLFAVMGVQPALGRAFGAGGGYGARPRRRRRIEPPLLAARARRGPGRARPALAGERHRVHRCGRRARELHRSRPARAARFLRAADDVADTRGRRSRSPPEQRDRRVLELRGRLATASPSSRRPRTSSGSARRLPRSSRRRTAASKCAAHRDREQVERAWISCRRSGCWSSSAR